MQASLTVIQMMASGSQTSMVKVYAQPRVLRDIGSIRHGMKLSEIELAPMRGVTRQPEHARAGRVHPPDSAAWVPHGCDIARPCA